MINLIPWKYEIMNSKSVDDIESLSWSEKELKLVKHVELFQCKPAILQKAENRFGALQKGLEKEIIPLATYLPKNLDLVKNQIARGENHNGFPFLSLDYPQNFSKTEMFTMRTLFWWGHYLGFSLILKGERLAIYSQRLLENYKTKHFQDIFVCLAPTPWEWELNAKNYSLVSKVNAKEFQKTILELGYLKLMRVVTFTDENFISLNWTQTGVQFWKDLASITMDN
tara:strand:+ start:263 stop:940 length:678 start_codon:yes stop_codon:yes gene_type:complete